MADTYQQQQQRMRMSPLDFEFLPDEREDDDEELPEYEASTAPAYDSGAYDEPLTTFCLRQYDRKIQVLGSSTRGFVTTGSSTSSSYRFTTNSFRLFSKKPEIEVLYTSTEMRQRVVATISFTSDGPLPWRPRAYVQRIAPDSNGLSARCDMESRNFTDWTFTVAGRVYIWRLATQPVSHVLSELITSSTTSFSSITIARFTYSEKGALAGNGAEIGELVVYRDCLTMEQSGMDSLVCGLMVAMTYLKKMGRYYRNEGAELARTDSLTREVSPLGRAELSGAQTF